LLLVLPILERKEKDPPGALDPLVRSKVASPAARTLHDPGRGASKLPLTTALELEEQEATLKADGVAVAVIVTVEADREEHAAVSVVVDRSTGRVTVSAGRVTGSVIVVPSPGRVTVVGMEIVVTSPGIVTDTVAVVCS
jgi:hypothetical protein